MESYIKSLIEIMKSEKESILEKKQINLMKFIDDIVKQGISIAVEYCQRNGEILLSVDCNDKNVQFIIEDSGRGFTKEELNSATEQFFQGDKSRNSKNHYGMGLYIARNLIEKHSGTISLENCEKLGGAKVILKIPIFI